jgi:DNA-binding transcriptional MerR regulator
MALTIGSSRAGCKRTSHTAPSHCHAQNPAEQKNRFTVTVFTVYMTFVDRFYSLEELVAAVNDWCEAHAVLPANGQASEKLTPRNVHYYRSLGMVDAPTAGGASPAAFRDRQRLQLIAIRLLQAQGQSLKRIRALLFGRSDAELREVERRGLAEWTATEKTVPRLGRRERWESIPLGEDFVLLCRDGSAPDDATLQRISALLDRSAQHSEPSSL